MKLTDRSGSDPWIKPKGSIISFFRRKPKKHPPKIETPTPTEIDMTLINEIIAMARKLLALWLAAKADIEQLKAVSEAYSKRITELEDLNAAHDAAAKAFMDEAMAHVDAGGSTGGVVG